MRFAERLDRVLEEKESLLCVGLDTVLEKIPASLRGEPDPLFAFNRAIIDATLPYAAAYKVNTAFYEAYGLAGWRALEETFRYLPADVIRIADAKRGDIGNTAMMYARGLFAGLGADAVTVNPLLGGDSVMPFLEEESLGVFFLCLTSNPGSRDFQHIQTGEGRLYEVIAHRVRSWNEKGNCGLVVGATHPEQLGAIRTLAPELPLLIPGIGAQGGELEASVRAGTDKAGRGALYNSSRAILYASAGEDFREAAASAARATRDGLQRAGKRS
ncbi:MAG TPA: orotidine-5'-phosphate decarboxylase [bacterium]|jgi:orotidine-5'-phosphate decarboxylase|nr:orotidine-5'-phosphate decarboxylase [bacterium]HOY43103.1 orotidine-5'-phosphate decarboxylase [bacterium]HPG84105.1 orotidine-5'-phosphate decarboxylase [bacterium]HPM59896.1 orotidine-5'-phosphate decarboxylase [bacterium]